MQNRPGSTSLLCVCMAISCFLAAPARAELIVNGDFEAGNTGFVTDYIFGSLSPPRAYNIVTNPHDFHPSALSYGDHTTGSGRMMMVNGAEQPDLTVWSQTVAVTADTQYEFSTWVSTWASGGLGDPSYLANLAFFINGTSIGTFLAPEAMGVWQQFSATWSSGLSTSATIRIVDLNVGNGNDFSLDDISLRPNAAPEPSNLVMLGIVAVTMLGVSTLRYRRRNS